ncbi:MAG: hypothetical protein NVSMB9_15920 [Isosphaeraceae bacterium]
MDAKSDALDSTMDRVNTLANDPFSFEITKAYKRLVNSNLAQNGTVSTYSKRDAEPVSSNCPLPHPVRLEGTNTIDERAPMLDPESNGGVKDFTLADQAVKVGDVGPLLVQSEFSGLAVSDDANRTIWPFPNLVEIVTGIQGNPVKDGEAQNNHPTRFSPDAARSLGKEIGSFNDLPQPSDAVVSNIRRVLGMHEGTISADKLMSYTNPTTVGKDRVHHLGGRLEVSDPESSGYSYHDHEISSTSDLADDIHPSEFSDSSRSFGSSEHVSSPNEQPSLSLEHRSNTYRGGVDSNPDPSVCLGTESNWSFHPHSDSEGLLLDESRGTERPANLDGSIWPRTVDANYPEVPIGPSIRSSAPRSDQPGSSLDLSRINLLLLQLLDEVKKNRKSFFPTGSRAVEAER